jgi:lysozyme family protein
MANFKKAIDFVLAHEGGYSNDPKDPGGETKYGISKRAYPDLIIANLTPDEAIEIYRKDYWEPCRADQLSDSLSILHFDSAVVHGIPKANIFLSNARGNFQDYLLQRIKFCNSLAAHAANRGFLRGWINRILDLWQIMIEELDER